LNKKALEDYLSGLKGAEGGYPFGPDVKVYKVMGKMFALVSQNEKVPRVTLKCDPVDGEVLAGQFDSIVPGYHMNKRHWITVTPGRELPQGMVLDLVESSYKLVVGKMAKSD